MTVIQIKRSAGVAAPTTGDLAEGELAYSEDRSANGAGAVLYIESIASDGTTAVIDKIGGKYYTNTVDELLTPATSTVGGGVEFFEGTSNGSNKIILKAPNALAADLTYTLPVSPTNGYFLQTNGSGTLSWQEVVSSLTIAGDSGTDTINTGQTLTFEGTANQVTTAVTDNKVKFSLPTDVAITGDFTVGGNDIKMNGGTTALTFSGSGDVTVAGDLTVTGNDIKSSTATSLTLSGADVTVAGDLQVSGNDIKMAGGTTALTMSGTGDVTVAGDLQVSGNDIKMAGGTTAVTFSGTGDVIVAGDLKVGGNDIKASDDTTTITLAGADVTIAGDLQVSGNDIKMNTGTTVITMSGSGDVALAGDLRINGNDIKASDNTTAITMSSADVTVAGDLQVSGNDIKMAGGTTAITMSGSGDVTLAGDLTVTGNDIKSSSATALTLSGANVEVVGDLTVTGNDIKSSGGTTALTLSGADVTVAGNLTVNGSSTIVNSTTVTIDDVLIKLADNNTGNSIDTGVYGEYVESATTKYAGWFRDASDSNIFKYFVGLQVEPTTTVDTTGTGFTRGTINANLTGGTVSSLASVIGVTDGGTGVGTFTTNGVLYGNGTGAIQATAAGTDTYILKSASGVPTWSNVIDGGTY